MHTGSSCLCTDLLEGLIHISALMCLHFGMTCNWPINASCWWIDHTDSIPWVIIPFIPSIFGPIRDIFLAELDFHWPIELTMQTKFIQISGSSIWQRCWPSGASNHHIKLLLWENTCAAWLKRMFFINLSLPFLLWCYCWDYSPKLFVPKAFVY